MRTLKKTLKILLLFITIITMLPIVFTYLYGDKIEQIILKKIQENSLTEIQVKEIDFSLFATFPYASVQFTDMLIMEKHSNNNDTLLYMNQGYLQFNIINLIDGKQELEKIVLLNAKLNIKYDNEGNPNFKIFKPKQEGEQSVIINQVYFSNSEITYLDQQKNIDIKGTTQKISLEFSAEKQSDFLTKGDLQMHNLIVGPTNYVQQKQMKINADFSVNDRIIYIKPSTFFIEDVEAKLEGKINGINVDLIVYAEKQKINSILTHMPEKFKSICASFIANGDLNCNGTIKGEISKTSNPHFNMDFNVTNGIFKLKENLFNLTEVTLLGNIDNGVTNSFENTQIKVEKCSGKTGNGTLSGMFSLSNLNNHYITADISSNLDLAEVNHYFISTPFFDMKGSLITTTKYNGELDFSEKMRDNFLQANHQSNIELKDVKFQYNDSPLLFGISELKGQMKNNKIIINNSELTISDSDMKFEGTITNFIPYLFNASPKIIVQGNLESVYVKFDELMTIKDIKGKEETRSFSTMPNWIEANLQTKIEQLSYKYFIARNIDAGIDFRDYTLMAKKVKMNTLNGEVNGEAKFFERPFNHLKLFTSTHLEKINIRNLFTAFENFEQDFIQDKHLKGEATADIQLQTSWTPGFKFDPNSLRLSSHLIINKGELIEFSPLLDLSSYVSVEELKDVKFSTLENNIRIEHNMIKVPSMEINSSALSVFVSGTHSFENKIDYQVRLLLSELISKKFRKKNTNFDNEFGVVDDEMGYTTLYLKMTGDVDNPEIYFDKIKIKEKLNLKVKEEKEEIKKIIKEDVLKQKPDSIKSNQKQEPDVILEWKDEL